MGEEDYMNDNEKEEVYEEESDSMMLDEEEEERDIIMKEEEEEEEDYMNDNEEEEEEEERANQAASIEKLEAIAGKYEEIRRVIEREIGADREKVLAMVVRDVLKHQDVGILEISKLHTK